MADLAPKFVPDVVAALKLVISAVQGGTAHTAQGIHPNLRRALALLDDPNAEHESPDPAPPTAKPAAGKK